MTIWQAIILGIVQGLSEFLPIGTSGHLILTPWLLHWSIALPQYTDLNKVFDVAPGFGVLIGVAVGFAVDIIGLVCAWWRRLVIACNRTRAAPGIATPTGEYVGMSSFTYWGLIISAFFLPLVFFGALFIVKGAGLRFFAHTEFIRVVLGFGLLCAGAAWGEIKGYASRVAWDAQGLQVTWPTGKSKWFAWADLQTLDVREVRGRGAGSMPIAIVRTTTGEKFVINVHYRQWAELRANLQARMWGGDERR